MPESYIPQIQVSMEVLDLEVCHFVQYRPDQGIFSPMQLVCTVVHRDRNWFDENRIKFQQFISDLEEARATEQIAVKTPPPKIKQKIMKPWENECLFLNESQLHEECNKPSNFLVIDDLFRA